MKQRIPRAAFSTAFLLAAGLHVFHPAVTIDTTALVLIALGLLPWLAPLVTTMELPGGFKVTFRDLEAAARRAESLGLLSDPLTASEEADYSFMLVATDNPNLALAGLRIEIERRLKLLAERNGVGTRMQGLGRLLVTLEKRGIILRQEYLAISDMIGLLNSAVHAEEIDGRAAGWALEYGPRLLKALDERVGGHNPTVPDR
jgi:hypothetical protein